MPQQEETATDSQVVELLGRSHLIGELLRAGLEVAVPARDRGVDLIAYADLSDQVSMFFARPIQMKAASNRVFGINQKYKRVRELLLVYVWHLQTSEPIEAFALSYEEAVEVGRKMGYTRTASWRSGAYTTTRPSARLRVLLEPFRMDPTRWWNLVVPQAVKAGRRSKRNRPTPAR